VRREKISERKEKREFMHSQRNGGPAAEDDTGSGSDDDVDDDGDESDAEDGCERTSYRDGDTLTTTVVSSLLSDPPAPLGGSEDAHAKPRGATGASSQAKPKKKFNLALPLATAIPGYKPPEGLQKKRKKAKKRKVLSKKEKARHRAPRRD
jgi:hypothetical protein